MTFIQHPVISNVLISHRINYVLIAISESLHKDNYDKLISSYKNLEKKAFKRALELNIEWLTYVSIGGEDFVKIEKEGDIDAVLNVTKMFEKSVVTNFYNFTTVYDTIEPNEKIARKEYTLIISDFCDEFFIKDVSYVTYKQNFFFQTSLLMIDGEYEEGETEIEYCADSIDPDYTLYGYPIFAVSEENREIFYPRTPPIYLHIFAPEYNSSDFEAYANMIVPYFSTPEIAFVNLFVLTNDIQNIPFEFVKNNIIPNCLNKNGSFYAYYRSLNNKELNTMALPLHFNEYNSSDHFLYNYKSLMNKTEPENFIPKNCENFQTALKALNALSGNVEQYNVIILEDPYPSCMNFKLTWENENRNLDIIVLYTDKLKSNYSNFSGARITYITLDNSINFSNVPAICVPRGGGCFDPVL
uniref:Uncharacterized protein n=1 Tax=Panagrolaimus davidi TaxID=227884 RepID=A0A914PU54_9BILA